MAFFLSFGLVFSVIPTSLSLSTGYSSAITLELRHQHAATYDGRVVFADIPTSSTAFAQSTLDGPYAIDTALLKTHHLPAGVSPESLRQTRRLRHQTKREHAGGQTPFNRQFETANGQSYPEDDPVSGWWEEEEIEGPDISKRSTLQLLAKMTNNAYLQPNETGWYDIGSQWNSSYPVGWEPDGDGFRGHVFASPDNSIVVLSIKGTSAGWLGGSEPTNWSWTTVCNCAKGGWKCDQDCLEESLIEESLFYSIGTNLYNNLTYMYPDSNIWIIGHSLGGALASLLGVTFGAPVVAFESPGEKIASKRLHLPSPPSTQHITHVYNTADPIPMGTCTGYTSACGVAGYAMEAKCHLGRSIIYDTVSEAGWTVRIGNHGIVTIIESLLNSTWKSAEEQGREVPEPKAEDECMDCFKWEFDTPPLDRPSE